MFPFLVMQEKYSLTWRHHSEHLKSMMKELMGNVDLSDVTLVTEDKKHIKANISILSACSPVFKDILKKEKGSSPIIYLRGVQYSEMESIIQFIYLGEATFYEERMDEFLAVAKSLEIKEFCNTGLKTKDELVIKEPCDTDTNDDLEIKESCDADTNDEQSSSDPVTSTEKLEGQSMRSDYTIHTFTSKLSKQAPKEKEGDVSENSKYECDKCHKSYSSHGGLYKHKQFVHQGVMYACDLCDIQYRQKYNLTKHIQTKHDRV